ncbi:hypothetical protein IF2G_05031 [Cordyceps javanica]|nr:hypothetical protein IF2G_05031 [Cordyceps javanica]
MSLYIVRDSLPGSPCTDQNCSRKVLSLALDHLLGRGDAVGLDSLDVGVRLERGDGVLGVADTAWEGESIVSKLCPLWYYEFGGGGVQLPAPIRVQGSRHIVVGE